MKVTRLTLGRLPSCPLRKECATGAERRRDGTADRSRGHSRRTNRRRAEPERWQESGLSMTTKDAEDGAGMPRAFPEGRARQAREDGTGASSVTAGTDYSAPEANVLLMELIVSRENMVAADARVVGNKGAAGIDKMSVTDLKPFLAEHWLRSKEDLLADRCQPQAGRGVEIPKPKKSGELNYPAFDGGRWRGGERGKRHSSVHSTDCPAQNMK